MIIGVLPADREGDAALGRRLMSAKRNGRGLGPVASAGSSWRRR